jgi:hypothetical protein
MSDEFLNLLQEAWTRVLAKIERDPDELSRRLARRHQRMMRRPPRAWCIAVRAADSRINPATAVCVPEDAAYPASHLARGTKPAYAEHQVTLDARLLRQICMPITPFSGVLSEDLKQMLGCSKHHIRYALKHGVLNVRRVAGVLGKQGWPVPLYSSPRGRLLDPSSRLREYADPLWGTTWRYLRDHIPPGLSQTITRTPEWTNGLTQVSGSERVWHFAGWKWLCPRCGKTCRTIFYPLPPMYGIDLLRRGSESHPTETQDTPARGRAGSLEGETVDDVGETARPRADDCASFACMLCHQVLYFSRINCRTWNHLISHLSGGLLYGADVPRPTWYEPQRKRPYHPILRRAPSKRREQVTQLLLEGLTYKQIGMRLGICKSTVSSYAQEIYRQRRVKGPDALRRMTAPAAPVAPEQLRIAA